MHDLQSKEDKPTNLCTKTTSLATISLSIFYLSLSLSLCPFFSLQSQTKRAGYMEKLKSSFKSLQGAITNIKPVVPTCIQGPKTHSFREVDLYSNFNCRYYDSVTTSSSSSGHSNPDETSYSQLPVDILLLHLDDDDDNAYSDAATISSSSSSARTIPISCKRFFFSPRTTSSIMEEAKTETGAGVDRPLASFCCGSTAVAMASRDPYSDFRASMEEMVAAHELRDWRGLQELLHCYLRLNEKKNHKVIVLAFADLLLQLMSGDGEIPSHQ